MDDAIRGNFDEITKILGSHGGKTGKELKPDRKNRKPKKSILKPQPLELA